MPDQEGKYKPEGSLANKPDNYDDAPVLNRTYIVNYSLQTGEEGKTFIANGAWKVRVVNLGTNANQIVGIKVLGAGEFILTPAPNHQRFLAGFIFDGSPAFPRDDEITIRAAGSMDVNCQVIFDRVVPNPY